MLFPAKLVRKQSRQGVGALQLRTTALHLDDAGNIDHVGYTDKVTATDFYQEQCNSALITIIYMQEHMLRKRVYITPVLHCRHKNEF